MESTSSDSEALTAMFLSISDNNRFGSPIADLKQDILKGNDNQPRTVTREYDMITRF